MIPVGLIFVVIIFGIFLFLWGFFKTIGDEPSFGAMTPEDKTVRLCHPVTNDDVHGNLELLSDEIVFKDSKGKQDLRISYSILSRCKLRYSTIAMVTGGNMWHYLGIYKKGESKEYVAFKFRARAFPYARALCSKIENKILELRKL